MIQRLFVFMFLIAPVYVFAQDPGGGGTSSLLPNPLRFSSIEELISAVLSLMVAFGIPIIALAFAYSGFLFVRGATGKSGDLESAKTAFMWSVVGGGIILGAEILARVLENTISAL